MRTSTDPGSATAERYRAFADVEARGMSACYEGWATGVAGDPAILALIDELPPAKRQPNLVFTAARSCGAEVGGYPGFAAWLPAHWAEVAATCLTHATQTNEPGRCAVLLPVLAALPGPLALIEVGASAGLCLHPDRYSYRYTGIDEAGASRERMLDPAGGRSPVLLDCALTGRVPVPAALPQVAWRAGIDLNPLDVTNPADVAWLEALIWPEHEDRRVRLRQAARVAAGQPVEMVRGDLNEQVEAVAARAPAGTTVVVFHTAVLAYLDEAGRDRFAATMARLREKRGVRWLANEGQGVVPGVRERLPSQPVAASDFVLALDGAPVAFTQPHGRSLDWRAPSP